MEDWELDFTKWWKVRCMEMDVLDYLQGDMNKETFIKYMKYDIEWLNKLIEEEENANL